MGAPSGNTGRAPGSSSCPHRPQRQRDQPEHDDQDRVLDQAGEQLAPPALIEDDGHVREALAIDVRTTATAAVSGEIVPFAASDAALAVVLALLTRPPTRLRARKPAPPR